MTRRLRFWLALGALVAAPGFALPMTPAQKAALAGRIGAQLSKQITAAGKSAAALSADDCAGLPTEPPPPATGTLPGVGFALSSGAVSDAYNLIIPKTRIDFGCEPWKPDGNTPAPNQPPLLDCRYGWALQNQPGTRILPDVQGVHVTDDEGALQVIRDMDPAWLTSDWQQHRGVVTDLERHDAHFTHVSGRGQQALRRAYALLTCGAPPPGPVCGDHFCGASETHENCPVDCPGSPPAPSCPRCNGGREDGICTANESHATCPCDCAAPVPVQCVAGPPGCTLSCAGIGCPTAPPAPPQLPDCPPLTLLDLPASVRATAAAVPNYGPVWGNGKKSAVRSMAAKVAAYRPALASTPLTPCILRVAP